MKYFFIPIVFFLSLLAVKDAGAVNYVLDYENNLAGNDSLITASNPVGENFYATANSIGKIVLTSSVSSTTTANVNKVIEYWICEGSPDEFHWTTTYNCGAGNHTLASGTSTLSYHSDYHSYFTFPSVGLSPGHQYYIALGGNYNEISVVFEYNALVAVDRAEYLLLDYGSYGVKRTLTYKRYADSDQSDYFLSFDYPIDYSVSTSSIKDFNIWRLDFNYDATSTGCYIRIDYGKNELNLDYVDIDSGVATVGDTSWEMQKMNRLDDGFWYALGRLYCQTYDTPINWIASTSVIQFHIDHINGLDNWLNGFTYINIEPYDINEACEDVASSTGTFWDDFRYGVECGFNKVIYWAFHPKEETYLALNETIANLTKIPVLKSYNEIKYQLDYADLATTSAVSLNLYVGELGEGGQKAITVLSPDIINNYFGDTWDNFYNIGQILIYLITLSYFIFWIKTKDTNE